jgi:integrase
MSKRGNGEGAIYLRQSDGRYVGSVHLGYVAGKRQRKSVYGATRGEVAEKMKTLLREQQQGLPLQTSERLTVATFLTKWLHDTAEPSLRPSSFDSYQSYAEQHIIPAIGRIALTKLTPQDVNGLTTAMTRAKPSGKGLSPRTAAHARAVLRNALADALRWGMVARNVAALSNAPRVQEAEMIAFTPEQAREFVSGIQGHREAALYIVALACGLRLGEITGLAWEDVDFEAGTLRVRQTLGRVSGAFAIGEPKSRNSRRTLALPEFALAALKSHKVRQTEDRLKAGALWCNGLNLVFTTPLGEPLNPSSLTRRFRLALTALKLPQMRFHDLRHSCAALLIAEGVHPRLIMETLGHSQISLTMNRYGHVGQVVQREVAGHMDGLIARGG